MIANLVHTNLGSLVEYTKRNADGSIEKSRGRIKAYDNTRKNAWVVFEENGKLPPGNAWKDLPSVKLDYSTLDLIEEGAEEQAA